MKVLHLTLKKKWFDMIESGEKKEEYREIKPYWIKRLKYDFWPGRQFDIIRFKNGYGKNSPEMEVYLINIQIGKGKTEWGAEPGKDYFVIKLGEKIN